MITLELLQQLCPQTHPQTLTAYVAPLNEVCEYYEINTQERVAAFVAQCAHESGGFTAVKENLSYGAQGLMKTFSKYFSNESIAKQYERQPEKIASRVYANRMGNGDESSGDGYKFCGRGVIQITGKNNYTAFSDALGIQLDECVAYMETAEGAISSAGWFWDNNNLNQYCDSGDFVTLTKRINGGTIGLEDRKHHFDIALAFLRNQ